MTALQAAGSNADGYNCYASRRYLQRVLFARQKLPTPLSRVSELTKYYCLLHLTRNGNGRAIRRIRRTTDAHESERITVVILATGRRDGQIGVPIQVGENIISKIVQRLWGTKGQIMGHKGTDYGAQRDRLWAQRARLWGTKGQIMGTKGQIMGHKGPDYGAQRDRLWGTKGQIEA